MIYYIHGIYNLLNNTLIFNMLYTMLYMNAI